MRIQQGTAVNNTGQVQFWVTSPSCLTPLPSFANFLPLVSFSLASLVPFLFFRPCKGAHSSSPLTAATLRAWQVLVGQPAGCSLCSTQQLTVTDGLLAGGRSCSESQRNPARLHQVIPDLLYSVYLLHTHTCLPLSFSQTHTWTHTRPEVSVHLLPSERQVMSQSIVNAGRDIFH